MRRSQAKKHKFKQEKERPHNYAAIPFFIPKDRVPLKAFQLDGLCPFSYLYEWRSLFS